MSKLLASNHLEHAPASPPPVSSSESSIMSSARRAFFSIPLKTAVVNTWLGDELLPQAVPDSQPLTRLRSAPQRHAPSRLWLPQLQASTKPSQPSKQAKVGSTGKQTTLGPVLSCSSRAKRRSSSASADAGPCNTYSRVLHNHAISHLGWTSQPLHISQAPAQPTVHNSSFTTAPFARPKHLPDPEPVVAPAGEHETSMRRHQPASSKVAAVLRRDFGFVDLGAMRAADVVKVEEPYTATKRVQVSWRAAPCDDGSTVTAELKHEVVA